MIVELGTWYGVSFLAFSQAMADAGSSAELHAIDTWAGDEHMGSYGEEVFSTFKHSVAAIPQIRATLHRTTFDQALSSFTDDSIDLLHIDGSHTYEALQNDFESWLPKLAPNGLVLMHDIDPSCGFGSVKYFEGNILTSYPNIRFSHSSGLGVVLPKGTQGWEFLISEEFSRRSVVYQHAQTSRKLEQIRNTKAFRLVQTLWRTYWRMRRRLQDTANALLRFRDSLRD